MRNGSSPAKTTDKPILNPEYIGILLAYRRLTTKEIGRRCGLSESHVRKAINNLEPISAETKRLVLRTLVRALRRKGSMLCAGRAAA